MTEGYNRAASEPQLEGTPIPAGLAQTTVSMLGQAGVEWLRDIPLVLAECAARWGLEIQPPFQGLSYNYVAPATREDGSAVVVKIYLPDELNFLAEVEALRLYDGRGAARLLDADMEKGVMLLERLLPGTLLVGMEDVRATSIAASVMRELWRPPPAQHRFLSVAEWARGFERLRRAFGGTTGPFPAQLVDRAECLYSELLASSAPSVVLHGDLHHYNILAATRQPWLAIDPKGVIGEPAYETGAWLRNPIGIETWPDIKQITVRRVWQLSEELGFDRQRIHDWATAQMALSAWWSYEDHEDWQEPVAFAQMLASLRV